MTDDGLVVKLAFVEKDLSVLAQKLAETSGDKTELLALFKIKTQQKNELRETLTERGYVLQ